MSARRKTNKRVSDGGFVQLPKKVMRSPNFVKLTPYAVKLLIDLCEQYNGSNNGDLCATWSMMVLRGWKSKETLTNAIKELNHYELIVTTQYGGLGRPSLYAIAWFNIDKARAETGLYGLRRVNGWQQEKTLFIKTSSNKRRERKKKQVRLEGQSSTDNGAFRRESPRLS